MKKIIELMVVGLVLLTGGLISQPITGQAKALSYDKSMVWPSRTITYHINSTGSYYRGIWTKAVKDWNAVKVVKLVKANSKSKAQIRLSTKSDVDDGAYFGTTSLNYKTNSTEVANISLYLSRRYMKSMYVSKHERTLFATQLVGEALGLNGSKQFGDIMSSSLMYNVGDLSKADKQGLKNAYKNVN